MRIAIGYVAGCITASAVLALTNPIGMGVSTNVLEEVPTTSDPRALWLASVAPVVTSIIVGIISFFLGGAVVGAVIGRKGTMHGLILGLLFVALGAAIVAIAPEDIRGTQAELLRLRAVMMLSVVVGATLGGASSSSARKIALAVARRLTPGSA